MLSATLFMFFCYLEEIFFLYSFDSFAPAKSKIIKFESNFEQNLGHYFSEFLKSLIVFYSCIVHWAGFTNCVHCGIIWIFLTKCAKFPVMHWESHHVCAPYAQETWHLWCTESAKYQVIYQIPIPKTKYQILDTSDALRAPNTKSGSSTHPQVSASLHHATWKQPLKHAIHHRASLLWGLQAK